jgi:hypothetical protein
MRARLVGYALTTAIAVLVFAGSGIANLVRAEHVANDMSALGYPAYFMTLLGVWKLLGAVVIALPRLARAKEWGLCRDDLRSDRRGDIARRVRRCGRDRDGAARHRRRRRRIVGAPPARPPARGELGSRDEGSRSMR